MAGKLITFVVRGSYGFPFDMLRYDQAWPTSNGVGVLDRVARGENRDGVRREPVDVELQTALGRVTDDRWRSFGWTVVDQRRGI